MKSKYSFRIFNSLLFLALLSFSFTAANCNDILDALTTTDDVTGTWTMTDQGGSQYDICNGETVTFAGTTATLTCPGGSPITRSFTTSGGILTYTETGTSYDYSVSTTSGSTVLSMKGRGILRTIQYTKQVTDSRSTGTQQKDAKQNLLNSSELK